MNGAALNVEAYKQELLRKSDRYRRALYNETAQALTAVAWVPRVVGTLRYASPILLMLAPAAAFLAGRWALARALPTATAPRARSGMFSKVVGAVRLFQQLKPIWDVFTRARESRHGYRQSP